MGILVIILIVIILFLAGYLFLMKKELRNIYQQLELIQDNDTNKLLLSEFQEPDLVKLIDEMNQFIHWKKMLEQQTNRKNKELQELVLNMSHDLRTPLTSIHGYIQMLSLKDLPDKKQSEYLTIVDRKIEVLNERINSFFELSKLDSKDYQLTLGLLNIHTILAETLAFYYPDFEKNQIKLEVTLEQDLLVLANHTAVEHIFQNLLDNLLKHKTRSASIQSYIKNERAYITFSNQTTDFDAVNLPHLFDKFAFFSQDSNSMSSGLGLTIVKELVEKMNGTIEGSYQDECLVITMSFQSERVE